MADARRIEVHRCLRGLFNVGTVAGLSDGELLDRFTARRGESAEMAFAALVERHGPMVLRVCRKVLHDSHDAADAFQATFLVLARKAGSIRRRDSLGSYLHGVALRVASCSRSAVARRRRHERSYAERAGTSYVAKPPDDVGRVLHEELGRLPERFRGVAVLCDLEGKTYVEAAGLLGCPPGTVMSRLAEARRRLRGRLARRGLAPSTGAIGAALAAEASATAKVLPSALAEATIQAATRFAAGPTTPGAVVSASVTALTEGVLRAMFLTKLKSLAMLGLVGGMVATGAGVLAQAPSAQPAEPGVVSSAAPSNGPIPDDPDVALSAQPGVVSSAAPSNDRLQSLENKLDRILNALESNAAKTPPRAGTASQNPPLPRGTEAMPGMKRGMMPGMMGGARSPVRAAQPAKPRGATPPLRVPHETTPALAGAELESDNLDPAEKAVAVRARRLAAAGPVNDNLERRLDRVEQRLEDVAGRLTRLEEAVFVKSSRRPVPSPDRVPEEGAMMPGMSPGMMPGMEMMGTPGKKGIDKRQVDRARTRKEELEEAKAPSRPNAVPSIDSSSLPETPDLSGAENLR